jgi:pilus assembly protein CpaE
VLPITVALIVENRAIWDELQASVQDSSVRVVMQQTELNDWPAFTDKLDRMRPDVVLLDLNCVQAPLDTVVQRIRSTPGSPHVFVLHTEADPSSILAALRAGASEFLHPPFSTQLNQALERISAERHQTQRSTTAGGRIIGFVSAKGGCGSTTFACHTATALANKVDRVLLADFDMDAGMIAFLMKSKSQYSILDALKNINRLDTSYWHAIVSNGIPHLEIVSSPAPAGAAHLVTTEQMRFVMRFARLQYDWTIIDLGRSLSEFTFRALDDIDETFIVTTLEIPALHQAKQLIQKLLDSGYGTERLKLLLNRTPKRSDITSDELASMVGIPVHQTFANDYQGLQESYAEGKLLNSASMLGRQFNDFAARLAGVETPKKKKFSLFG